MNMDTQALMMGYAAMVIMGWLFILVLLWVAVEGYEDDGWLQPHYRATDAVPDLRYEDVEQQNDPMCRWRPSIFMPRWASRITLEITDVRVERLKDISDGDAMAEGIYTELTKEDTAHGDMWIGTRINGSKCVLMPGVPQLHYSDLWESINGAGSWNANPWVWVVEFKRIEVTP